MIDSLLLLIFALLYGAVTGFLIPFFTREMIDKKGEMFSFWALFRNKLPEPWRKIFTGCPNCSSGQFFVWTFPISIIGLTVIDETTIAIYCFICVFFLSNLATFLIHEKVGMVNMTIYLLLLHLLIPLPIMLLGLFSTFASVKITGKIAR